ncbi:hypothetical protein B566_EDAN002156 [Ephemera danica]|nr:hypothetical protein B566_EDAN002156 [Ephemera danica]
MRFAMMNSKMAMASLLNVYSFEPCARTEKPINLNKITNQFRIPGTEVMAATRNRQICPQDTCRGCSEETRGCLQEFGEATSLHGVHFITGQRGHLCERLCWTVAILVSAVLCCREITKLYIRWQDSPVITSFARHSTPVSDVPFPAVTICPESKVLRSVMDVEEKFDWLWNRLNGTTAYHNETERLLVETISIVCESDPDLRTDFPQTKKHSLFIPKVTLHSPVEYPLPWLSYFYVSPSTETMVSVLPERIETDADLFPPHYGPKPRACFFPQETSGILFRNLTQHNCLLDIKIKVAKEKCNCTFHDTPVRANCGGLLGLFTGFSVITVMEICYFASLRLACRLRERRIGQQH